MGMLRMNTMEPTAGTVLLRGAMCKCPSCGKGHLFRKLLKVVDVCDTCGEELYHHRADDMPAYVVMTIVGHIVVGLMLWVEMRFSPPFWVHAALWFPLAIGLSLGLLQPVKGIIVAFQWHTRMHGFGARRPALHTSHARAS
jgi:uncharacterized protein (DUF983 family)